MIQLAAKPSFCLPLHSLKGPPFTSMPLRNNRFLAFLFKMKLPGLKRLSHCSVAKLTHFFELFQGKTVSQEPVHGLQG